MYEEEASIVKNLNVSEIVQWYNDEQTIIYIKAPPQWSWDEAHVVVAEVIRLQDSVSHGTHVIYDLTDSPLIPSFSMPNLRRLLDSEHPNDLLTIIVTYNRLINILVETVNQIYKVRDNLNITFAASVTEAMNQIAEYEQRRVRT